MLLQQFLLFNHTQSIVFKRHGISPVIASRERQLFLLWNALYVRARKNRKKTLKYKHFHFSPFSGDTQGWPALCGLQRLSSDIVSGSRSFVSLPQLIIKAPSHFHFSFLLSKTRSHHLDSFWVYLSLQQTGMKEMIPSLANGRASFQCGAFSLDPLTPSPLTIFCSFLAWVFILPGGWPRVLLFYFFFISQQYKGVCQNKWPTWGPFICGTELLPLKLPLKCAGREGLSHN